MFKHALAFVIDIATQKTIFKNRHNNLDIIVIYCFYEKPWVDWMTYILW